MRVSPGCAAHSLRFYLDASLGWRCPSGPPGSADLWRLLLTQLGCRVGSSGAWTTLHFPPALRPGWSDARRATELEAWAARLANPAALEMEQAGADSRARHLERAAGGARRASAGGGGAP